MSVFRTIITVPQLVAARSRRAVDSLINVIASITAPGSSTTRRLYRPLVVQVEESVRCVRVSVCVSGQ